MIGIQNLEEGHNITVTFTDEKGMKCELQGEIISFEEDDVLLCEEVGSLSVVRFVLDKDSMNVRLLLDNDADNSTLTYDVNDVENDDEIKRVLQEMDKMTDKNHLGNSKIRHKRRDRFKVFLDSSTKSGTYSFQEEEKKVFTEAAD